MQVALDLVVVGTRRAGLGVGHVLGEHRGDVAVGVLLAAGAFDDEAVAQAHHVARVEAVEALDRLLHEVLALDPQFARERHVALAQLGLERMVRRLAQLGGTFGVVGDDELERVEHRDAALGGLVEVVTHAFLEHAHVDPRVGLGDADALGEAAEAGGGEAAAAGTDERRQARVVPAGDVAFIHQLDQLALGQHHVGEVEARELDLLRQRAREVAFAGERVEQPVVERTLVLELERAHRVRDVLDRVLDRVGEGVHRVDAPGVAGAMVGGVADAVDRRVTQVDVGARHVDLRAQDVGAFGELAGAHAREEVEVFVHAAVAVRAVLARLGQRATVGAHLLGRLRVHIGLPGPDQAQRAVVHAVEVVRGEVQVFAPLEAEPLHRLEDGVDVLLLFLLGVGVVEAHVAGAAVGLGEAEVQADRLGVAVVQVAVGLGRKARLDAAAPFRRTDVLVDDVADEIGHDGRFGSRVLFGFHRGVREGGKIGLGPVSGMR